MTNRVFTLIFLAIGAMNLMASAPQDRFRGIFSDHAPGSLHSLHEPAVRLTAIPQDDLRSLFLAGNRMHGYPADEHNASATEPARALKSKGRAFLYSLLLPGLGERYAGAGGKAEVFMGAELTLWLGYFGFLTYGDRRTEDYKNYATAHAGIDPQGKPYNYFVNIGNYDTIEEYNAAKLRQRDLTQYYRDSETYYWQWDSSSHRERFERIRKSAARADNNATLMLGAIFANHLISAIDAVWTVHKHNRGRVSSLDWRLQFGDGRHQPQLLVSVQKRF